mgnify:CR=1 FL=1
MSKFDFTAAIPDKLKTKIPLLPVKDIEPSQLQPNPKNAQYFRTETSDYFERLTEDIRKRGILVPLIAQKDGTILAGHNRWEVAKRLKLKFVPVQYIASELSEQEIREFIIKDNLLRRQFTSQEWMEIYKNLYPDFEQRLAKHGQRSKKRVDNVHSENSNDFALTAERIAADTGQSKAAVQKQLQRKRQENKSSRKTASTKHTLSTSSLDTTLVKKLEKDLALVESSNETTKKAIAKILRDFARKIG